MRSLWLAIMCCISCAAVKAQSPHELSQTVNRIDAVFAEAWENERVTPAALAGDSEYLRRLTLDLAGRIPAVSEVRDFIHGDAPGNRREVVERLLDSPAFVRHFTTVLRNALIPQANSQPQFRGLVPGFDAWLWGHLAKERPYDEIVRDIITTELNFNNGNALSSTTSPDAFFAVRELKPENLAAGTARAFLGVRLDCAQCHDHPFDKWKQEQFWNLAAFYSGFSRDENPDEDNPLMMNVAEKTDARSIKIPGTENTVPAVFLTGTAPEWKSTENTPRQLLANWIVADSNPYFAKMAVNRVWAQFFGHGIVDPVDDFSENNPPSHPEVLEVLSQDFISSGYDLKRLVRVITATQVYQLSSVQSHESQSEPSHFARAVLRGLTPEQFFDSLAEAVGFYQPYRSDNPFVIDTNSPRARFLDLFRDSAESALERETTILQALAMMNGDFIGDATSLEDSQTLKAVIEFPGMTDSQRLQTVFLASLSRQPTIPELQRFEKYLAAATEGNNPKAEALSDVFWALLNCSEFLLNH
jgi:hypothetical protein